MEKINPAIKGHQVEVDGWTEKFGPLKINMRDVSRTLYKFFDLFNAEFFCNILPQAVITFKDRKRITLGHFRPSRNDIGCLYEINLNVIHINRPMMLTLSTLLHEMCHFAQHVKPAVYGHIGRPCYHNKRFCDLTAQLGIPSSTQGCTLSINDPFKAFCIKHGISEPPKQQVTALSQRFKVAANNKLKKYTCECGINVRVAVSNFNATCNHCRTVFVETY